MVFFLAEQRPVAVNHASQTRGPDVSVALSGKNIPT
jgi:hypothetical protein